MQEYLIAFAVGGTICALSQLLMDKTKLMPGRIMVILVVTGVVLGAFGIYEPFKEWAGAGASVPLLGFGNTLWKGVKKPILFAIASRPVSEVTHQFRKSSVA